jgi:hypothetical protein
MNKKAILIASLILGLVVLVPLVAAAPSLTQNQNGDVLQTQDQLRIRDCDSTCLQDGTCTSDCPQNGTCTQDKQCLQTRDCNATCNGVCDSDGICDGTQTQTRQRQCQQELTQNGGINTQYRNRNQNHCGR